MEPFFSVIVVCLNPGERLKSTLESIERQTFRDFQVIVKDGGSRDGAPETAGTFSERWKKEGGLRSLEVITQEDCGIYDAMNQAAAAAEGRYVYFLNCGDCFSSGQVLEEMAAFIRREQEQRPGIYYGDIYERLTGQRVCSNPRMDAFGCYRDEPCHQACFYARELLLAHPFHRGYQVRADYEQFLWCFFASPYKGGVKFAYSSVLIADYEGGGFSESRENRELSAREHKEITGKYMSRGELFRFRLAMALTLSGLRTKLAENGKTAGVYNRVKEMLYRRRK